MIIEITLTEKGQKAVSDLKALGDKITAALRRGLNDSLTETINFIAKEELSGQKLNVRTGSLRRSLMHHLWSEPDAIAGAVVIAKGPADKYAAIQEFGGTIRPKQGRYLAVPTPFAQTGAGALKGKYAVNDLRTLKLACFKAKNGKLFLWEKRGKRQKPFPIFRLMTSVTIKGKGYMQGGAVRLRERIVPVLQEKINEVISA